MKNPVKYHALSMTSPLNPHIRMSRKEFGEHLTMMFTSMPEINVVQELDRLFETGQLVEDASSYGVVVAGVPIFEDGVKVTVRANRAARAIWKNMEDRRDIKHVISRFDPDVQEEIINTFAALIDKSLKS
jgi:hypothetical protein